MRNEHTRSILSEIHRERARQDEKFGAQEERDYPDTHVRRNHDHMLAAQQAQHATESAKTEGRCTWEHILDEEICEAYASASISDTPAQRAELIQCAAVIVAWIEAIDNRVARREGKAPLLRAYAGYRFADGKREA